MDGWTNPLPIGTANVSLDSHVMAFIYSAALTRLLASEGSLIGLWLDAYNAGNDVAQYDAALAIIERRVNFVRTKLRGGA